MIYERFGVKECFPLRGWIVNLKHKEELKNRENLLKMKAKLKN